MQSVIGVLLAVKEKGDIKLLVRLMQYNNALIFVF